MFVCDVIVCVCVTRVVYQTICVHLHCCLYIAWEGSTRLLPFLPGNILKAARCSTQHDCVSAMGVLRPAYGYHTIKEDNISKRFSHV